MRHVAAIVVSVGGSRRGAGDLALLGFLPMNPEDRGRVVIALGAIHGFVYALVLHRFAQQLRAHRWVDPEARVASSRGLLFTAPFWVLIDVLVFVVI
ncbi:MAG: hypothetical protein ACRC2H_05030 [Silanimonas sp.]